MQMATDQTLVTNYTRLYSARLCTEGSGPTQNNNTAMHIWILHPGNLAEGQRNQLWYTYVVNKDQLNLCYLVSCCHCASRG